VLAAGSDYLTDNPGTFTRSLQQCCHRNFHALDGNRWLLHRCL